jgi:hypothetical protein
MGAFPFLTTSTAALLPAVVCVAPLGHDVLLVSYRVDLPRVHVAISCVLSLVDIPS